MTTTTSQLQITTTLDGDQQTITATVLPGGYLPQDIFLYQNTGTTALGDYYGVANTDELKRFQAWTETAIPKFGNAYVRYSSAKITLNAGDNAASVISNLTLGAQNLSNALKLAASTTTVITIS